MPQQKTKLELTWIGKENRPRLEPRILLEDSEKSYSASTADTDYYDNRLIFGDNLLALKALEQEFYGKVKCIYIDPPYNTGSAFESYDDGVEHSLWLSLMRERLVLLWSLLSLDNGVLLISINDDECHYLKVLCDELFGRNAFISTLVWNYEGNTDNQAKIINYHEYILVYSKTGKIDHPEVIDPNVSSSSKLFNDTIRNTIIKNGPKNPVKTVELPIGFPTNFSEGIIRCNNVEWPKYNEDLIISNFKLTNPVQATTGWSSRAILENFINNNFEFVADSKGQKTTFELTNTGAIEAIKIREQKKGHFLSVLRGFGTTNQMRILLGKMGIKFTYPKPVDLIAYLIKAFSNPGDIILDSFAGSGTTAHAVLELNKNEVNPRKFILVEINETTVNEVILPRLKAVISGHPAANIAATGGGFKYYRLAPSLLEKDKWDNWIISKKYNAPMLSEAICKLEGFTYAPSETIYWQQGYSTENDYIYVTTNHLTHEHLQRLSEEVGDGRSLLVLCASFKTPNIDVFPNLTVKKIPQAILNRCEWGHDDYSLNVSPTLENEIV
ncbi:site-specific DNA-methyltransferase [Legionella longbeachae]|uniref:site-specific DNA-methyltransferase n=1 Tax=Legionella longbeachae TaxID=450 RepID=UPI0014054D28|nr:site-specific DNA-methyltransferase [Legionella longbeachae]QIN32730.1 site-specific DNA-methyltransferase [Legionella longbeachae]